jgi:hypothetical protein|tara:strand:- start:548 stop:799 length:252 start_codon:yes stop_codon:yes gene_type:complete
MKNKNQTRDLKIAAIAAATCHIPTLETQNSDSLDFHDVAVWGLRDGLAAAYEAGRVDAKREVSAAMLKYGQRLDKQSAKEVEK